MENLRGESWKETLCPGAKMWQECANSTTEQLKYVSSGTDLPTQNLHVAHATGPQWRSGMLQMMTRSINSSGRTTIMQMRTWRQGMQNALADSSGADLYTAHLQTSKTLGRPVWQSECMKPWCVKVDNGLSTLKDYKHIRRASRCVLARRMETSLNDSAPICEPWTELQSNIRIRALY